MTSSWLQCGRYRRLCAQLTSFPGEFIRVRSSSEFRTAISSMAMCTILLSLICNTARAMQVSPHRDCCRPALCIPRALHLTSAVTIDTAHRQDRRSVRSINRQKLHTRFPSKGDNCGFLSAQTVLFFGMKTGLADTYDVKSFSTTALEIHIDHTTFFS